MTQLGHTFYKSDISAEAMNLMQLPVSQEHSINSGNVLIQFKDSVLSGGMSYM